MLRGSLCGSIIRAGIYRQAYRVSGSAAGRQIPRNVGAFSGLIKGLKIETRLQLSIFGNLGIKPSPVTVADNVPLPCALSFRSYVHSGEQIEVEAGKNSKSVEDVCVVMKGGKSKADSKKSDSRSYVHSREQTEVEAGKNSKSVEGEVGMTLESTGISQLLPGQRRTRVNTRPPLENEAGRPPMSMDYVQGLMRGSGIYGGPRYQPEVQTGRLPRPIMDDQPQLESNADIVHIKLMRNNSYVTLTDHKGDRKMSVSAGQVAAKGDKPGRYSGEVAAEYIGRVVKQMKIRSVVVKVSGFTFFRRKKDAILAFKDGYTHSRGDVNPVVYIEDTTRKPHNGCRLSKKRRI